MSNDAKATLNFWIDIIFKLGTPVGLVALFFLKGTFATHDEVAIVADRVGRIETAMQVMVVQNQVNTRQDEQLRDHEGRIRLIELRPH